MRPSPGARRLVPALITLLAACQLTACAADPDPGDTEASEPVVASTPRMLETAGLTLPLDVYETTAEQRATLTRAQDVLIGRCMARYGFTFNPPDRRAASKARPNSRVFGLVSATDAARYGYRNPAAADRAPAGAATAPLTKAEEIALHGDPDLDPATMPMSQEEAEKKGAGGQDVPVGGCVRESFLKLYAPRPDSVDQLFVFNLRGEAESRARADSRIKAVDERWSQCMAKAGFRATDPMDAADQLGFTGETNASPAAITAAKADVGCKKDVNLVGVHFAVTSAYHQRLIDKKAETLALVERQSAERLRLAASLTS
ncbi:hypothetical protein [Streptomyces sp. NPDC059452]|uniref:hypothetical protein n=1 Tax=Streptomyces sp. NPDC059452 TaxID=3346835 RepID=UPI00367E35EC